MQIAILIMADENEEKIRQDKIARLTLRLTAESTYFTIEAVILALAALVMSLFGFTSLGTVYFIILIIVALAIIVRQLRIYAKIDELFPQLKELDSK
jgi:hypothetical protein